MSVQNPVTSEPVPVLARPRLRPGRRAALWLSRIAIWCLIVIVILPMWFVVEASFNPSNSYLSFTLWPSNASLANYAALFQNGQFWVWLRNSLIVSISVGLIQVLITALGAFAFSRMRFWGRKYGLMVLILLQMFPAFLSVSAFYAVMTKLNMMDALWSYILVMISGSAYNIWLMKGYFDTVPRDLDEAALMDGANSWQRFWYVLLPPAVPMIVVIFLFTLVGMFGEYIFAGMILQSPQNYTLAVGMYNLISGQFAKNWGEFSAAALLSAVPLTVIFGLCQRWLASGLVAGATKG